MSHVGPEGQGHGQQSQRQSQKPAPRDGRTTAEQRPDPVETCAGKSHAPTVGPAGAGRTGLSPKLWTTRDLQLAAAAGALLAGFESEDVFVSDFLSDFLSVVVVVVVLAGVVADEPERLSVR